MPVHSSPILTIPRHKGTSPMKKSSFPRQYLAHSVCQHALCHRQGPLLKTAPANLSDRPARLLCWVSTGRTKLHPSGRLAEVQQARSSPEHDLPRRQNHAQSRKLRTSSGERAGRGYSGDKISGMDTYYTGFSNVRTMPRLPTNTPGPMAKSAPGHPQGTTSSIAQPRRVEAILP